MKISDWLLIGGTVWLLKKSASNAAEEREEQERENRQQEKEYKRHQAEEARRLALEKKRKNTPCYFNDGISSAEFFDLATQNARKIKQIKNISVNGACIDCTVASQTGYSDWIFHLDFNDWGHITGTCWTSSENSDSNIPDYYEKMMTSAIHQLLTGQTSPFAVHSNYTKTNAPNFFNQLFSKHSKIALLYDWTDLKNECLSSVISLLQNNGFINIKSIPINDIGHDSDITPFQVEQILINGSAYFNVGDIFKENVEILITYHKKKEINMPYAAGYFQYKNYIEVGDIFESLGFSEIYENSIEDLKVGFIVKDGSVENVSIGGNDNFKKTQHTHTTQKLLSIIILLNLQNKAFLLYSFYDKDPDSQLYINYPISVPEMGGRPHRAMSRS